MHSDTNLLDHISVRTALQEALAAFCLRIDAADYQGVATLFTEDCITDYGPSAGGEIVTRRAFLERIRISQARFRRTHHQLGQMSLSIDGDDVRTVTYVTASHRLHDGSRYTSMLQYHDRWRQTPEGWRISERRTQFCLADVFNSDEPTGPVRWAPRVPN